MSNSVTILRVHKLMPREQKIIIIHTEYYVRLETALRIRINFVLLCSRLMLTYV